MSGIHEGHGFTSQVVVEIDSTDYGATAAHRSETADVFVPRPACREVPCNLGIARVFALMCPDVNRPVGDLPVHSPQIQDLPDIVVVAECLDILTHHRESADLFDGDVGQDKLRESLVRDIQDGHAWIESKRE